MKVLFVCRQNVGRSQMAKAFYNHLTHTQDADAAGTHVAEPGQTLLERKATSASKNFFVLDAMKDEGIDISNYKRRQIALDDLNRFDAVICMVDKDDTPEWLVHASNYIYWNVKDPRGQDYDTTARVRDVIKRNVEKLIISQN